MTPEQSAALLAKLKASPTDKVVETYNALRALESETKAAFATKLAPITERKELVETAMLDHLNRAGAQNIKTAHGTLYTYTQKQATIVDAEALWAWAKANDASEIYQKRVTISEVEARNEANPDNPVAGLQLESIKSARVRAK